MTHYDVLGVPSDAPDEAVRKAYLRRARRHHPDLVAGVADRREAERVMQRVNEAWHVLGDPVRRHRYDCSLGLVDNRRQDRREWQPLEPDDPDEVDPRDLLDDTPITGGHRVPTVLQVAPPLLVAGGIIGIIIGSVTAIPGTLALGLGSVALGMLLFLCIPVATVFGARRSEQRQR